MAFSRLFACDACPFDCTLVFAEEFAAQITDTSEPPRYEGRGKVGGLVNRLWCGVCRAPRSFVLVRLHPPADHAVVAYAEAQQLNLTGGETGPCPLCETLLLADADGLPCPKCDGGTLRFTGEWEDAV